MWNTRSLEQAHRNGKHSLFMQFHLCCTCDDRSECLLSLWPLTIRYCNQNILLWCLLFTVKVVFSCNVVTLKSYLMNLYCNCLKRAIKFFKKIQLSVSYQKICWRICFDVWRIPRWRSSEPAEPPRDLLRCTPASLKRGQHVSVMTRHSGLVSLSHTHTHTHTHTRTVRMYIVAYSRMSLLD